MTLLHRTQVALKYMQQKYEFLAFDIELQGFLCHSWWLVTLEGGSPVDRGVELCPSAWGNALQDSYRCRVIVPGVL